LFTKRQSDLLGRILTSEDDKAPHLNELSGALTRAFGGVDKLAEMLANLANDAKKPDWLRTRAAGLVVNTISAASKLESQQPTRDIEWRNEAELMASAKIIFREVLGITNEMDAELRTVVAAWPELPPETRKTIVDLVTTQNT
jgi:hypothetical protein